MSSGQRPVAPGPAERKELKITFTINDVGVDKNKAPPANDVDPCTNPNDVVLDWEGCDATITIAEKNGAAIADFAGYGPLAHFKNGIKYYYITVNNKGKFIPGDLSELPSFVSYLKEKLAGARELSEFDKKHMHAIVEIVFNTDSNPGDQLATKINDAKTNGPFSAEHKNFLQGQGAASLAFTPGAKKVTESIYNLSECKKYIDMLDGIINPVAGGPGLGGGNAYRENRTRRHQNINRRATRRYRFR
jgi:hypothetical protein